MPSGVNTFRNAIGAHYLPHSSEYVAPPSIDVVRQWFPTIRYGEEVSAKGTLRKSLLPPSLANGINIDYANIFWEDIIIKLKEKQREKVVRYIRFLSLLIMHKMKDKFRDGDVTLYPTQVFSVNNWALKPNQPEEPTFTNHMLAICSADKLVVFKAPKLSSNVEWAPQGIKPGAQPKHKKYSTSSKQPFVSSKEATKGGSSKAPTSSKTSHSKKRKGNDASKAISTAKADPRNSTPSDFVPQQQSMNEGIKNTSYDYLFAGKGVSSIARQVEEEEASSTIKLEDLAKLVLNVKPSFKDLDSLEDDPVIVVDDSDEDEEDKVHTTTNVETEDASVPKSSSFRSSQIQELTNQVLILESQKHKLELKKNKAKAKVALLKAQPSFPNVGQLNELLVKSLQTKFSKILSAHDFSSSLPTKLKDLPSMFNELTEEVKGLKKQVHELEIELSRDLKEIPTKLEDFTKTITSLTSQVAELKTLQWELPAEFLSLSVQVTLVQAKLKTLDALPCILLNVTTALKKFSQVLDSASSKAGDQSVPSPGQAETMLAEGEKNTNQATIS
ncbi:hypothetical protein Tco_1409199 [Tanacetum coccineum]